MLLGWQMVYNEKDPWRWIFPTRWATVTSRPVDITVLGKLAGHALGLLFPADCRVCGVALHEVSRLPVCRACLDSVEPFTPEFSCVQCRTPFLNEFPLDADGRCPLCREGLSGFDAAYSFGSYDGTLRKLVHILKYERVRTMAAPLGTLLARAAPRDRAFDAVIAMPMHWYRRFERGFNQADLLAGHIGRRLGVPVIAPVRRRWSPRQSGLTMSERKRMPAKAFEVRAGSVEGKRILLIDDVLTTGATAGACGRALKSAGAAHVSVLTVARADRRFGAAAIRSGVS